MAASASPRPRLRPSLLLDAELDRHEHARATSSSAAGDGLVLSGRVRDCSRYLASSLALPPFRLDLHHSFQPPRPCRTGKAEAISKSPDRFWLVGGAVYPSRVVAAAMIGDEIANFYNSQRRHSCRQDLNPIAFELRSETAYSPLSAAAGKISVGHISVAIRLKA